MPERNDLIAEAEARIQAHPEKYVDHIYGKDELGGTSWMYLSPVPFEQTAFPTLRIVEEPETRMCVQILKTFLEEVNYDKGSTD